MMPDLGKYAADVLLAYGLTFALLGALITASLVRARKVKRQLAALEDQLAASAAPSKKG